jgi:predicted membrane protein
MKEKTLSIILFVLVTSVFLFSQNSYAEQSAPPTSPLVMAIQKLKIE